MGEEADTERVRHTSQRRGSYAHIDLVVLERRALLRDLPRDAVVVLDALARGRTYVEVAADLGISVSTVGRRLEPVKAALGARDRSALAGLALQLGLGRDQGL